MPRSSAFPTRGSASAIACAWCRAPARHRRWTSLVAFLGDSVATYKLPERLELFTQFPFTPTGKIQRHALVREVVARIAAAR